MSTEEILKKVHRIEIRARRLSQEVFAGQYDNAVRINDDRDLESELADGFLYVFDRVLVLAGVLVVGPNFGQRQENDLVGG